MYPTRSDCADALGVTRSAVSECINGHNKTCRGYHLELIDYEHPKKLDNNIWKAYPEDPSIYVSKDGRAISYKSGKPVELSPIFNPNGYITVGIAHGETCGMHRLVAKTFIPNPEDKPTVHHKDNNQHNNNVENLEWATYSENILHSYHDSHHSNMRQVRVIETGVVYNSIRECSNDIGVDERRISDCINGKRSSYKNYHFESV